MTKVAPPPPPPPPPGNGTGLIIISSCQGCDIIPSPPIEWLSTRYTLFLQWKFRMLNQIRSRFVTKSPIVNKSALIRAAASCRWRDEKPLHEPFLTYLCETRRQWVIDSCIDIRNNIDGYDSIAQSLQCISIVSCYLIKPLQTSSHFK